jgi:hypothetical protein
MGTEEVKFADQPDDVQDRFREKAVEVLGDLLWCSRVWEAWSVGTMGEDDFIVAADDDDIVNDTAEALWKFVRSEKE